MEMLILDVLGQPLWMWLGFFGSGRRPSWRSTSACSTADGHEIGVRESLGAFRLSTSRSASRSVASSGGSSARNRGSNT